MSNAPRLIRMLVLFLSAVLMLLLASIAAAQEQTTVGEETATTNNLTVADQPLGEGDTVVVSLVSAMDPSWVVIQRASTDVPGQVVGKAAVPTGVSNDVIVVLSKEVAIGAELLAALHIDAGVEGVYEYPVGPDRSVLQDGEPVSQRFSIMEAGAMPDEEPAAEAEEPATEMEVSVEEEPAAEAEEPATEMEVSVEEEPAAEAEAPMQEESVEAEEPATEMEASVEEEPAAEAEAPMQEESAEAEEPAAEMEASVEEEPAVEEEASTEEETPAEEAVVEGEMSGSLLDIAAGTEGIKVFVEAVRSSELLETLRTEDLYTVFAPNDEAFTGLPEETLDELMADPEGKLNPVLRYHVVPGELPSSAIVDGASVDTLQGNALQFRLDGDSIMVNDANIVEADIEAVNGIIHIIDSVLSLPSATDMTPGEVEPEEDTEAGTTLEEPGEMPATGGSSSMMVIFVVMGLVAMGWAANILMTRHGRRMNETI